MPRDYDQSDDDPDDDFDDFDDAEYDRDDPKLDPISDYADSDLPLVTCGQCGEDIPEDCVQCSRCGAFQSQEDAPAQRRSNTLTALAILALVAVLTWILGRG
jgi:predicted nucleic acid-binding Zn ribbon protein